MISITLESELGSKIKGHMKRNWPLYAMGTGAVISGVSAGQVADRLEKSGEITKANLIRATRAPALVGTGIGLAKASEKLRQQELKKKKLTEADENTTTQKTADVIEKTGGQRAVSHLRKHWKKYASLAGAGLAASLAGEGMRLSAGKKIRDIASSDNVNTDKLKKASKLLTRGEVTDTIGTTATVGGGSLAAAGKLFDRRKVKRT